MGLGDTKSHRYEFIDMSCNHPLKGFKVGINPETGNDIIKVTPYKVDHLWRRSPKDKFEYIYDEKLSTSGINYKNWVEIPCGKCISCRLKKSREWANRCMLELPYHEQSWFVTLTYDDDHLPTNIAFENGFFVENGTLVKKDLQDFFKRLRKNYKYDNHIKYYACGEYGSDEYTHRPHYHCIIFGLKLDDLTVYKTSRLGFNYYNSEFLNSVWPFGHVVIADVSWDTCAYTARYIMKKKFGLSAEEYEADNILPEFTVMSLKPAIGYEYFKDHKSQIYDLDSISISTSRGGKTFKPPKYFDLKMKENEDDASILEEVQTVRQEVAELNKRNKLKQTDLDYLSMLQVEEDLLKNRISSLKRKEI